MTSEGGVKQVSCEDRQCVKAIDEFHNVMHSSIRFVFCDPVSTQGVTSVKHPQCVHPVARGRKDMNRRRRRINRQARIIAEE